MLHNEHDPVIVKVILIKRLSNGAFAKFVLARQHGEYKALLYVNGKRVNGPPLPLPLDNPKDEITHWMGNKPAVGLTTEQAEMIENEVTNRIERIKNVCGLSPDQNL